MRARRHVLGKLLDDFFARSTTLAGRVPKTTQAHPILNVKNKIVAGPGSDSHRNGIKPERVTSFPRNDMICAGGVAADTKRADNVTLLVIKGQAAAEHNDSTDRLSY